MIAKFLEQLYGNYPAGPVVVNDEQQITLRCRGF